MLCGPDPPCGRCIVPVVFLPHLGIISSARFEQDWARTEAGHKQAKKAEKAEKKNGKETVAAAS